MWGGCEGRPTVILPSAHSGGAIPEGQGVRAQEDAVGGPYGDALHDTLLHSHPHWHLQCLHIRLSL